MLGTGVFKSEDSDERLAQPLKGESRLGQLSADEPRLLTQVTGAQYRATARPPVTDSAGNQGTVAAIEVNGQTFVGLNSHNYAGGDGLAL